MHALVCVYCLLINYPPVCSLTQDLCGRCSGCATALASKVLQRHNMSEHWGSGEHPNLFIIYAISGMLQSSKYPKKKPWPTILCPIPVFRLPLKHLFSFCKLLVKKTNLKRMCVLVTSCIGFSCTSCVAQLGYNRLASVNCPLKQCVAQLPLE